MTKKHKKNHKSDREEREDKPLKLVLKVGGPSEVSESIINEQPEGERKHKHKKKKKKHKHDKDKEHRQEKKGKEKRKHEEPELEEMEVSEAEAEPPAKKIAISASSEELVPSRTSRDKKVTEEDRLALQKCLDYLHKILLRKDVNGFFAYPVTDQIAPGYSIIIKQPMDLSTMREKIDNNHYNSVVEYKRDFLLMCDNCMTYNHPETVFYKEAKRLHTAACKQITKEKVIQMKKNLTFMASLGDSQIGLEAEEGSEGGEDIAPINVHTQLPVGQESPAPVSPTQESDVEIETEDYMSPEEILAQAQAAAKGAAERLTLRKPLSKFGFLKRRADGSTTLNLLNPDNEGIVSETERIVTLGSLAGKIQSGTGSLAGFKEDKRNKATPVNYLTYGPFSSYAPVYDSSAANVSKEESDLLLTTYGDEMGTQYSKSIQHFVKDANDYCVKYVDNLLDILTGNEHSKTKELLEERQKEEDEKKRQEEEKARKEVSEVSDVKTEVDLDSLRSLSDLGIDMSFLDDQKSQVDNKLQETSNLIGDLHKVQNERLSQSLPAHLAHLPGPSEKEVELADKLTKGLTDLVKQARPSNVISATTVRDTIGITIKPDPDRTQNEVSTQNEAGANTDTTDLAMGLEEFLGQGNRSEVTTSDVAN